MKRLEKILLILVCVILMISAIDTKVFSYTLDEVKKKIDYKTVEEDGEPSNYDVLIEADDLIKNEKLPYVQYSIEDILYGNEEIFDVDFLNKDSENSNDFWKGLSKIVNTIFHITLYISAAAMLTLLIYMAIVLVSSSISSKDSTAPLWTAFNRKTKNPLKASYKRGFIEGWLKSVVILVCMVYVINLITSFAGYITEQLSDYKVSNGNKEKITVYVKGSEMVDEDATSSQSNFQTSMPVASASKYMFIGDSRTVGIQQSVGSADDVFFCKSSKGYDWMVGQFSEIDNAVTSGMAIIIWMGVNDIDNIQKYIDTINSKATEWISKGANVSYASLGPVDDSRSQYVKNSSIEDFNQKLQNGLSSDIHYIDIYGELKNDSSVVYDSERNPL